MDTSLIGRRLGKYEIQAEIGRGGMGVVYRAYDPVLQRAVAIKVLPPHMAADPDFVRRFHREAILAAQLKHSNIVTIHDVGDQDGVQFIVMELLEGATLDRWLSGGLLSLDHINRVLRQVADALDFAHKRNVIHRDIKPSNIMINPDGQVTLLDFGLVRATEGTMLTMSGAMMGTPQYMAPEQAQGTLTDHRTDIYSLGIVIYRLLTGHLPFERTTTPALIHAHVYESPPPLRQLRPDLPKALEAIVHRAIAKLPDERYQSAGQFARDFEATIGGKTVPVAPLPPAGRGERPRTVPTAPESPSPLPPSRRTPLPDTMQTERPLTAPPRTPIPAPQAPPAKPASKLPILIGLLAVLLLAVVGGAIWMISGQPKPTPTPVDTIVQVPTDSPTPIPTDTPVVIVVTATPTPTSTAPTSTPTRPTNTPTLRPTRTPTSVPTDTPTAAPTATRTPTRRPTTPPPPARPGLVFDFEQNQTWRRGDEPYGTFTRSNEQVKDGASSGKLAYDYPAVINNYVVFELRPAKAFGGQISGLTAWVFGDGSKHYLNVWIKDQMGEVRAYSFGQINHQGWKQMTVYFDDAAPWPAGHVMNKPDNGRLDQPASFYAWVLDGVPNESASRGAIYLDEVFTTTEAIPQATPTTAAPPPPHTTTSARLTQAPPGGAIAATGSLLSLGLLLSLLWLTDWPLRFWRWLGTHDR